MHSYHVGIALHHIHAILLGDGLLRLEETVELVILMIDLRVGRVHVFLLHALGTRIQQPASKGYYLAAHIQPREDNAARIAVTEGIKS